MLEDLQGSEEIFVNPSPRGVAINYFVQFPLGGRSCRNSWNGAQCWRSSFAGEFRVSKSLDREMQIAEAAKLQLNKTLFESL